MISRPAKVGGEIVGFTPSLYGAGLAPTTDFPTPRAFESACLNKSRLLFLRIAGICPFIGLFGLLCLFSFSVLRLRGAVTNLDWSQNRPEKPRARTQSNGPRSGRGRLRLWFWCRVLPAEAWKSVFGVSATIVYKGALCYSLLQFLVYLRARKTRSHLVDCGF